MSIGSRSILVERGPVSLGCGTLILIALIVLFFSSHPDNNLENIRPELQRLQNQVSGLRDAIRDQTREIATLQQQIKRLESNRPPQAENPNQSKD